MHRYLIDGQKAVSNDESWQNRYGERCYKVTCVSIPLQMTSPIQQLFSHAIHQCRKFIATAMSPRQPALPASFTNIRQVHDGAHEYPSLTRGSLGRHESVPNGISIGSAVFARHTSVTTDQHTQRRTLRVDICNNRPHRACTSVGNAGQKKTKERKQ